MKTLQYKLIIALLSLGLMVSAQKVDKQYNEEFNVNDNVVIDINTRHTDIEIETWNKNKVVVEATIEIEGARKEKAEGIIEKWVFKALGNKNEIDIVSKSNSFYGKRIITGDEDDLIHINDFDFDFVIPEVSVDNLAILDSLHIVMPPDINFPELLIIPEMEDFNFSFDSLSFDYEKYKNEENYFKQWQEQMKNNLAKMRVELKENSIQFNENSAHVREELKAALEERKKALKEHAEHRKEAAKQRKLEEEKRKEIVILRKKEHENRNKELADRRIEIKNILANRDKIKVKRVIRIKAPKDAKFNMNVSYGSVSFPD